MHLIPSQLPPWNSNGRSLWGPVRRGLWQEVAAGPSSLTLWLPAWPAVLPREPGADSTAGVGCRPAREGERVPGCWRRPTAEPRGGWQLGSGYVCQARNSPRSAHRPGIMPVASVGEKRAGCLFCLPPSLLPRGETEAWERFPRPGRVSMAMGAGVRAPSCRQPPNKGESGTLMGARPLGRASQPS